MVTMLEVYLSMDSKKNKKIPPREPRYAITPPEMSMLADMITIYEAVTGSKAKKSDILEFLKWHDASIS